MQHTVSYSDMGTDKGSLELHVQHTVRYSDTDKVAATLAIKYENMLTRSRFKPMTPCIAA